MDYGPSIRKQFYTFYAKYTDAERLDSSEVEQIVLHANTPGLWQRHPFLPELEFNAQAGQIRKSRGKRRILFALQNGYSCLKTGPQKFAVAKKRSLQRSFIIFSGQFSVDYMERLQNKTLDHQNRVSIDDRVDNLQPATAKEQNENRSVPSVYLNRRRVQSSLTREFQEIVDQDVTKEDMCTKYGLFKTCITNSISRGHRAASLFWRWQPDECLEGEEWRPLVTYGNHMLRNGYQVSSHGRVKTPKFGVTMGSLHKKTGYLRVGCLTTSKQCVQVLVHVAVCTAFEGPCPTGKTCDHKDRNKLNNHKDNLWWSTSEEQNSNRTFS